MTDNDPTAFIIAVNETAAALQPYMASGGIASGAPAPVPDIFATMGVASQAGYDLLEEFDSVMSANVSDSDLVTRVSIVVGNVVLAAMAYGLAMGRVLGVQSASELEGHNWPDTVPDEFLS